MAEDSEALRGAPPVKNRPRTPSLRLDIPLGAFQLTRLLGVGGMGEVWEGFHRTQGVPVAVKVITAARARDPRYREAFRNEVRAVAGLDHPGVVMVFDQGELDAAAEQASEARMVAGSPYLAMELANGGSLRALRSPRAWSELKFILVSLLDILAHAHARGVIHRDLKPANVLVFRDPTSPDSRVRLKLTDFGLAHATDTAERGMRGTSGTPTYMAPEQFLGQWRDFGPWTDLYGFGCLAYALAHGNPPFQASGGSGLRQAHLASDPAPLVPRLPVPQGFEAWIGRLMAKDPVRRFQCAADALWVLDDLGDPAEAGEAQTTDRTVAPVADPHTVDASMLDWDTAMLVGGGRDRELGGIDEDHSVLCERRLPPMPDDWREHAPRALSMRLVGAGLGLYGLRAIPIVDRERERDALWEALAEARVHEDSRGVVLQGGAGAGKSRLAEWVVQRGRELGVATFVQAVHSRGGGPTDGLPRMVQRALSCVGLTRMEMLRRTEAWLRRRGVRDDYEWNALTELVWPATEQDFRGGAREVRFSAPQERYALIHRLLTHVGGGIDERGLDDEPLRRAVIVWLDDVQWGPDALGLARYLLRNGRGQPTPLLIVCTVQEEALEERPAERAMLEVVLRDRSARRVSVDPLGRADRARLVQELLGLEGELATQVEERTGGNPLFAVQLVGDWVQRGVLEVGPSGFVLRRGERASLPDDIHELWTSRIARALEGQPLDARVALELAAMLGNEVDEVEWRGACNVARVTAPPDLVSTLIQRRLAQSQPGGWTFAHAMLRESLARSAQDAGRSTELHEACATTLQIRYETVRTPGLAERLGHHLTLSGRLADALDPLQAAATERRAHSDYEEALRLLDRRDAVLERLGIEPSDPRWGEGLALRADLLIGLGRLPEADAIALRIESEGTAYGWRELVPTALRHAGAVAAKQGLLDLAEERLLRGRAAAKANGDDQEGARTLLLLGDIARLRGDPAMALRRCRKALGQFAVLGDPRGQADVLIALSAACRVMGDLERTESYARQAIPLFERVGSRFGVASCENALGEVLRARGDLVGAEQAYRQAELLLRNLGSPEHRVPQLNLGLVLLHRGHFERAQAVLREVLEAFHRGGRRSLEGALHVFLLPCAAQAVDWRAWRRHLEGATTLLQESGFVDGDIAWAAELGADQAERMGGLAEARAALALASAQWRALGNPTRTKAVEERIGRLERIAGP